MSQLTLDEKKGIVTGAAGPCGGNIAPIDRLNFTGLCLQDGPAGIRSADFSSAFSSGISTAATWDRKLIHQRGVDMGKEFKGKGAEIALG